MSTPAGARTTDVAVEAILGPNWDGTTDPSPFIEVGMSLASDIIECRTAKGKTTTTALAELLERWASAYSYTNMDPMYKSRMTEKARGEFVGDLKEPEWYKKMLMQLDNSGCANAILNNLRASGAWLGRNRIDQTDLEQR